MKKANAFQTGLMTSRDLGDAGALLVDLEVATAQTGEAIRYQRSASETDGLRRPPRDRGSCASAGQLATVRVEHDAVGDAVARNGGRSNSAVDSTISV
ncbi:MAG: hypothetical protein R3E85_07175 [Planctomycetota bacterium]